MGVVAQDGVSHIVVVGRLHVVEEYDVLKFHRVAHDAVRADESRAAHESAVPYLGVWTDDAGRAQISGGEDLGGLVHPDVFGDLGVFFRVQRGAEFKYEFLYSLESFPGVFVLGKAILCQRMFQVEKISCLVHGFLLAAGCGELGAVPAILHFFTIFNFNVKSVKSQVK